MLPERVSDALSPLPPGYADLLRSVVHLLSARTEVRAVWVAGSVGREAADAGSDVDLVVTVAGQSAIFPAAVLAREDWLLGQESVASYRTILYRIFLEANQPQPPMGVKQWSSRLTPEQRDVLMALTLPSAHPESVVADIVQARRALRTHGRAAVEKAGGTWPVDLDEAMATLWRNAGLSD